MRYGERFCSRCHRNGCACPPIAPPVAATYRSCLHDVSEGNPCARCDDMRLADVPEPKLPALSGRRIARSPEHEPGFVTLHDRAFERVALVSPEAARRIAVIDAAIAEDPEFAGELRDLASQFRQRAEDDGARAAKATGEVDRARRTELEAGARVARRREALYLAILGADSDVAHGPKVRVLEPAREGQ